MSQISSVQSATCHFEKIFRKVTPGRQATMGVLGGAMIQLQSAAVGFLGEPTISSSELGRRFDRQA
jgi:hypothetical protein